MYSQGMCMYKTREENPFGIIRVFVSHSCPGWHWSISVYPEGEGRVFDRESCWSGFESWLVHRGMVVSFPNLWCSSCVIGANKHQPLSLSTFFCCVYLICTWSVTTCLCVINMVNALPSSDFPRLSKWMRELTFQYHCIQELNRIEMSVLNTRLYHFSWRSVAPRKWLFLG